MKFNPEESVLTKDNVILCHTIFGSPKIQNEYADKMVLVDGFASCGDVALAMSYGFKKVISL